MFPPKYILIAPDKFRGSLKAEEVAAAMAKGVSAVFPNAKIMLMPLADGGDGTAEMVSNALGAKVRHVRVKGPLRKPVEAGYGLLKRTAYIDLATASGLALISHRQRNPLNTSTYGLGQVMIDAVNRSAIRLVIGVGGSATVDAGMGAMQALGIRFLDRNGKSLLGKGGSLNSIWTIDSTRCLLAGKNIEIILVCDVTNSLLGPNGAARVFGPQKGATKIMVSTLENGLKRFSKVIQKQYRVDVSHMDYGGAGGGVSAGFFGVFGSLERVKVRVVPGIEFVLDALKAKRLIRKANLILTGEGSLDEQTSGGKTISGLSALARKYHIPVLAYAGHVSIGPRAMRKLGLSAAFTIVPGPCKIEESFRNAAVWIEESVKRTTSMLND